MTGSSDDRDEVLARCYPNLLPGEREEAAEVLRRYLLWCMRQYEQQPPQADEHPHRHIDGSG